MPETTEYRFQPLEALANNTAGFLYATAVLDFAAGIATVASRSFDYDNTKFMLMGLVACVMAVKMFVGLGAIICFCRWQYRSYANLIALETKGLTTKPRYVVWSWFIPFYNLFAPYQQTVEIWRASDPRTEGTDWKRTRVPRDFGVWWTLWLLQNSFIQGLVTIPLILLCTWVGRFDMTGIVNGVTALLNVLAALVCVRIIQSITTRQHQRFHMYCARQDSAAPKPIGNPAVENDCKAETLGDRAEGVGREVKGSEKSSCEENGGGSAAPEVIKLDEQPLHETIGQA